MSESRQPWRERSEIPDPQIRDAADQFESARQLLSDQPPGSGVLYPLVNTAAIAIELYLKYLSAQKVYIGAEGGWSAVSARSTKRGHILISLLDQIGIELQDRLTCAFQAQSPDFGDLSLRDTLSRCEGAFEKSRYPFEATSDASTFQLGLLMACSHFLQQFVGKLPTNETIRR